MIPPRADEHVVIIGAGFSGTLLAINILRHDGPRVTLAEREPEHLARGVAYSAADDSHLLNVRAANMSAIPDDRLHFVRWLEDKGLGGEHSFVRRTVYGTYLNEMLSAAMREAGERLRLVRRDAVSVRSRPDGLIVGWADGGATPCDRVVLALGNLPPNAPPGIEPERLPPDLYCEDPWSADIADGLEPDDEVLLIGTGLTAVDAALLLERRGFTGRITAMSRRGLRPRAHEAAAQPFETRHEVPSRHLSALVRDVRNEAERVGWRQAVDALRPVTQLMWAGADAATRQRFLQHLRPFWDVHRHRLAPSVAAAIDALVEEGRLEFRAGKLVSLDPDGEALAATFRPRGSDQVERRRFRRVVNCTGPQGDLLRTTEPLLAQLRDAGSVRPDCARLGIDIAPSTNAYTRDGGVHPRLYAIGPMTRGTYWEVVAVPDIRVQSWNLARFLANAHWVGGEGL